MNIQRSLILLLLAFSWLTSSVSGANLRGRKKAQKAKRAKREKRAKKRARKQRLAALAMKKRHQCPSTLPEDGSRCRRHPKLALCDYESVQVPIASPDDGTCTGALTCQPTVQCGCHKKSRTWKCTNTPWPSSTNDDVCTGDLPVASFDECSPGDDGDDEEVVVAENPGLEDENVKQEQDVTDIFVRDDTALNVDDACPTVMPVPGATCLRRPDLDECPFDFANVPIYDETDGTCRDDMMLCLPLTGCNCFDGVWQCHSATVRRCNGDTPSRAFQPCPPPTASQQP